MEEKEATKCYDQMLIVEKYETVILYLYPIAQNLPRKHTVARDMFLETLLGQVNLFIVAGKSNQASRLYQADAGLAMLRFWLRFLGKSQVRGITPHQMETAQMLIAEVGKILGAWIMRNGQIPHISLNIWRIIMALLAKFIINSRADLDAIAGTPEHTQFMDALRSSITRKEDQAEYPENYGMPDYDGEPVDPVWVDVEDLSTIESFGFTKEEILAL